MKKAFWFCAAVFAIELIVCFSLLPTLPEQIPTHFGFNGAADSFGGRGSIFLVPCITFPIIAFVALMLTPIAKMSRGNVIVCALSVVVMKLVFTTIFVGVIISVKGGYGGLFTIDRLTYIVCGIGLVALGNFLPRTKQNPQLGVRTPWTLKNVVVWQKSQRFGGWAFVTAGVFFVLSVLIPSPLNIWLPLAYLLLCAGAMAVYSWRAYKRESHVQSSLTEDPK